MAHHASHEVCYQIRAGTCLVWICLEKVVKFIGAACGARMAVIVSLTGFCGFCCGA